MKYKIKKKNMFINWEWKLFFQNFTFFEKIKDIKIVVFSNSTI